MKGSIVIDKEFCKGCKFCVDFCTKDAVYISERINIKGYNYAVFDEEKGCTGCANCALMCPEVAIEVYRE